jgi:maleate isomerase
MTGKWHRPAAELEEAIAEAARALSDTQPGIIVFHCTASSMEAGLAGETRLVEQIENASGCPAITTGQAVTEALRKLRLKKLVLISPYVEKTNQHEVRYLKEAGFEVIHDLGLGLIGGDKYFAVTPEHWQEVVFANSRLEADGYFLSCTNTTMVEVIEQCEEHLHRPVVTSNQATLWACLQRLGLARPIAGLGKLLK